MPLTQEDIIAEAIISGRHTYQIETNRGVFTCHLRTFKDDRRIAMRRDQLLVEDGGDPRLASAETLSTYHIQATIEILTDKYPDGFVLEAASSEDVAEIYVKIQQYEESFRKNGSAVNAENSPAGRPPADMGRMQSLQPAPK